MSEERTAQPGDVDHPTAENSTPVVEPDTSSSATRGAHVEGGTVREVMYKRQGTREQVPATRASSAELRDINATTVLMDRSGAERITADRVTMDHAGARTIDAKSAQLDQSGAVVLGSDHAVLLHSSAVHVAAEEARVTDSRIVLLNAAKAHIESSRVLLFAGTADGDVSATITTRSAGIFGAAFGLVLALVVTLSRWRSRG